MRLNIPISDEGIDICENMPTVLIVENPNDFYRIVKELQYNITGEKFTFALYQNHKELKIKTEVDIVDNIFDFTVNSKKFLNKLHLNICSNSKNDSTYIKWLEIMSKMESFLQDLLFEDDHETAYNQIDVSDFIKMYGVRFVESEKLEEKVMQYIDILSKCTTVKLLVFVNLKTVLDEESLSAVYKFANYQKMQLLLLENTAREKNCEEKQYILDKDLFLIYK